MMGESHRDCDRKWNYHSRCIGSCLQRNELQGTVGGIPTGANRTFTLAYDTSNNLIYQGVATGIQITGGGAAIAVAMMLQQVNAPIPFTNVAPIIDVMTASGANVAPGTTVKLNVTAHDPNAGDTITYLWTATDGTFNNASNTNSIWAAPTTIGVYTVTIIVTDNKGASASLSLNINVQTSFSGGAATITVGFNTFPVISTMNASPSTIDRGYLPSFL